jgi:hypothetical protein
MVTTIETGYIHTNVFMNKRNPFHLPSLKTTFWLLVKLLIYIGFVTAYLFLVLFLLRHWLKHMFDAHRDVYALVALPLIIAQAVLLHLVTIGLRRLGSGKAK